MRVTLSPDAKVDLLDILDFIATESPRSARDFVRQLRTTCSGLAEWPNRFPIVGVRGDNPIHRAVHGSYSIFYSIAAQEVYVLLRIIHSARDHVRLLALDD